MTETRTVDTRGLSCPQPAILVRQAIRSLERGAVEVLVDSATSRETVSRLAANAGWTATVAGEPGGGYRVLLKK